VLSAARPGALFGAGSSVFTEIALTNTSDGDAAQADLVLEAQDGEIAGVTGDGIATAEEGARHLVRIGGLAKDKEKTVTVEMKVGAVAAAGQPGESRLTVTLRKPAKPQYETKVVTSTVSKTYCRAYGYTQFWQGSRRRCARWGRRDVTSKKEIKVPVIQTAAAEGPSDSTVLRWPVSNCAGDFYGAIVKLREKNADAMDDALKRAHARDRLRPGRWLFPPSSGTKAERRINGQAVVFVRTRGIDPQMSTRQNYGWVSQKVTTDLRGYLNQPPNPAICTGVARFVDFFDGRMKDFWQRADDFSKKAEEARAIAAQKLAAARGAVKSGAGDDPAGGTTAALPTGAEAAPAKPDLRTLTISAAELTGDGDLLDGVKQAAAPYEALERFSKWMMQPKEGALEKDDVAALKRALGAIEAAEYLTLVAGQYNDLRGTIQGSMAAIRDAHARHCRCGG